MKLIKLGLTFMALVFTITTLAGCSSERTTNSNLLKGSDSSSAITSPQTGNNDNEASSSSVGKPSASSQADLSSQIKPSINSQPSSSSGEKDKFFYGTWIIKKYVPTTNVSSLSEKDINNYIGLKITVDKNQIVTNQGTIKNPIFEEKTLTNNDFFEYYKVQFSSLGIIGNNVTQVEVSNYKHETRNGFGSDFYFSNNDKAYTNIGGCFFELSK